MTPILACVKLFIINNNIYNKYNTYININKIKETNKELYKLLLTLNLFKEQKGKESLEDFILFFFTQFPNMRPDDSELFSAIFERLSNLEVSEDRVVEYLLELKKRQTALELARVSLDVSETGKNPERLVELVKEIDAPLEVEEDEFVSNSLVEIKREYDEGGLSWRLETLNRMLGPLRRGNCGLVVARPEVGKTTLLASEVSFMAQQMESPILWINNEQDGREVLGRVYQAIFGITQEELFGNLEKYQRFYDSQIGDRIRLFDRAYVAKKTIDKLCEKINPRLIVIDQIDKIRGFDAERYDLKLKEIYQWARELAKEYGPTISVCQAGGTAEGKKWIDMNDIDSSHTAKQGEVDWILGIGKTNDEAFQNERYLHLCKNKLPGGPKTIRALRHGKCPVKINAEIARYEDSLRW